MKAQVSRGGAVKIDAFHFKPGHRIELHPATDGWMMGDRFGVVTRVINDATVKVLLDRSGDEIRFLSINVMHADKCACREA